MTAADTTATEIPVTHAASGSESASQGRWTPFNLAIIIIAFVVFWPIGLFLLAWVGVGRQLRELPAIAQSLFSRLRAWMSRKHLAAGTGNRVFDEYQQTQYDRIDEIRTEIRDRDNAFRDFKEEQDRALEQKQFDQFMQKTPAAG